MEVGWGLVGGLVAVASKAAHGMFKTSFERLEINTFPGSMFGMSFGCFKQSLKLVAWIHHYRIGSSRQ